MGCCSVKGCNGQIWSSGLCSRHYNRLRTTGTTDDGPRARASLADRFWRNVDRRSPQECWPWVGQSTTKGYGYVGLGGRGKGKELAHRVAWVLTKGRIPSRRGYHGTVIRHKCHNRLCCNPAHLKVGTQADNVRDMWNRNAGPKANARLTKTQVAAIRCDPRSSRQLAPVYDVSDAHIRSIRQGRCWKAGKHK